MTAFCGVDVGSLRTPAYVAWLRDQEFILDLYIPSGENPLPPFPAWVEGRLYFAFDAPQGLPADGRNVRKADQDAKTPTQALPRNRTELHTWKLYRGLIEAGMEIFWSIYEKRLANIFGLDQSEQNWAAEAYPRYTLRQWWPDLRIPSKKNEPSAYVDAVWSRLQKEGYRCPSLLRPTVDQVDAMLCALAALSITFCAKREFAGSAPLVDEKERVLREGWIV